MQYEFDLNVKLKQMELQAQRDMANLNTKNNLEVAEKNNKSAETREKMKQGKVSGPPKSGKPTKSFESKGNDVLGGLDLGAFEPK